MNITFLIGNGFDVGLGMKSRFKDFFPIYKEKSQNKEPRIKYLSDSIEGNYDIPPLFLLWIIKDSNLGPTGYEPVALTAALMIPICNYYTTKREKSQGLF